MPTRIKFTVLCVLLLCLPYWTQSTSNTHTEHALKETYTNNSVIISNDITKILCVLAAVFAPQLIARNGWQLGQ